MTDQSRNGVAQTDRVPEPRITVIGVGGAGGNAINNMIRAELEGVGFVVAIRTRRPWINPCAKPRFNSG
jgi:cell division protein FtsZ